MDQQRLEFYAGIADMFKIVEVNGKQAAFLIAIRDGADYPNDNFGFYSKTSAESDKYKLSSILEFKNAHCDHDL